MKRITLSMLLLLLFSAATISSAQIPSTPPARPAPVAPAAPVPMAPMTPMAPMAAPTPRAFDEMAVSTRAMEAAMARADRELAATTRELDRESARMAQEFARTAAPYAGYASGDRFDRITAPPAWAPNDPADSIYRVARELLNRGDWGRAARMFADIQKNYPNSAYEKDAPYYEAYARYKIGTTEELRQAARILEPIAARLTPASDATVRRGAGRGFGYIQEFSVDRRSDNDVLGLYARIN